MACPSNSYEVPPKVVNDTNQAWVPVLQFKWYNRLISLPIACPQDWPMQKFQEDVSRILDRFLIDQELMWERLHRSLCPWGPLKYHTHKKENAVQFTFYELVPLEQKVLALYQKVHPVLCKAVNVEMPEGRVKWTFPLEEGCKPQEVVSKIVEAIERAPAKSERDSSEIPPVLLDFLNPQQEIDWIAFRSSLFREVQVKEWRIYPAPPPDQSFILCVHFPAEQDLDLFCKMQEKCPFIPRSVALRPRNKGEFYLEYTIITSKIQSINTWMELLFSNCK